MKENNQLEEVLEQEENSNEVYEYENYDYITNTKPLGKLVFLVAFTAIMLISSTYAWFSTQKNVTISGLKGEVNVAEGLQMSLDAEHWVNTINFDHFNQPTDGSGWTVKADSPTTYLNNGATFQAPATGVTNVVPEEYKPVSTTGRTNEGIGKTSLIMYNGEYTETEGLNGIDVAAEERDSGYYAFDLFLMNTSAEDKTADVLKLDTNSIVTGINSATGIQNTMRVALALYENNNADEDFDAATATAGTNMAIDGANALTPAQIIAGTSTDKNISDVAIWEPNADAHVSQIISSTANSIKFSVADRTKYTHLGTSYDANTGISKFADGDLLPTYGITADSAVAPSSIADVYDWATPGRGLKKQYTLQTKANETRTEVIDLLSIKKLEANENATDKSFEIVANQYQKVRVYVWIEGQDPDCINYASLGQGLELTLGITKGDDTNNVAGGGDEGWVTPSEIYDADGTDETKLHLGDFVNYSAGTWTADEINEIQTGLASSPVTANNSTNKPSTAYQFGGFTAGSSRDGNATPYSTTYNYVKRDGADITGWRVFDIDGDNVTLISAGNPEDYYHASGTNYGYISEYILTGNVNSSWSGADTSLYAKRDWSDYVNEEQKATSATVLTKSKLDTWYSKYTDAGASADTYGNSTFQKIYAEPYIKYQSMVENYSYYWLSAVDNSNGVYVVTPEHRNVGGSSNYSGACGVRVLVSLSSEVLISEERADTTTISGGNMATYGGEQTFNVWDIK